MGIVNVTPDSFSDGGDHDDALEALAFCEQLVLEGADVLDIGGESTRPGAQATSPQQELSRVLPVLRGALSLGVPVSIDTSQPRVMQQALDLGVDIVNDVRALRDPGALAAVQAHPTCGLCLMHMLGEPATMAAMASYEDVVSEVRDALLLRLAQVTAVGIDAQRIVLDPGIGFAKNASHNLQLLAQQHVLSALPRPLLVGWSRKGTLGQVTGRAVHDRLAASVAAALLAVDRGARIVRVHDVAATVDALKLWRAATTSA